MAESTPIDTLGAADARDALRRSEEAAAGLRASVSYPPGFVAQMAVAVSLSSIAAGLIASDSPIASVISFVLTAALLVLAITASRRFDKHNGVRIHGFRGPARAAIGFLVAGVALNIAVAYFADTTGAWWLGIAAAPIAAVIAVVYLRRWLAGYRGEA
jgi:hypothetical protein